MNKNPYFVFTRSPSTDRHDGDNIVFCIQEDNRNFGTHPYHFSLEQHSYIPAEATEITEKLTGQPMPVILTALHNQFPTLHVYEDNGKDLQPVEPELLNATISDKATLLQVAGWTIECESPLEIRHQDGSFATGQAAKMVISSLEEEPLTKVTASVACDGRVIDSHWNGFSSPEEAIEYFDLNCARLSGKKYSVIVASTVTREIPM